jgi:beta-adrenergic-receptor kinase
VSARAHPSDGRTDAARLVLVVETVFDTVNQETDKAEQKRRAKFKQNNIYDDEKTSDLILQGQLKKNTGTFGFSWQIRYTKLYPNRLELHYEKGDKDPEVSRRDSLS